MTDDFEYLHCPMCGGKLVYSEGTHDLCCVRNGYEIANREAYAEYLVNKGGAAGRSSGEKACSLHETAGENEYRTDENERGAGDVKVGSTCDDPAPGDLVNGGSACADSEENTDGQECCVFALSFTKSTENGTLWSVRVIHGKTDYFKFMTLLKKIEGRQKRGERLAENMPSHPKKIEKSPVCKLAFRYGLEAEDLYSIKFSSETVSGLSLYYGISERAVRDIRNSPVLEGSE